MLLNLATNGTLRIAGARGTVVKVLDGRVWITEAGRRIDAFLVCGARYDVAGDGVVVIGAEADAKLDLKRERLGWFARWLEARRGEAELAALSDHSLRDIGLRRDEVYSFLRR
jgi:uncharacterized protein YjiS (DUF1127 family)